MRWDGTDHLAEDVHGLDTKSACTVNIPVCHVSVSVKLGMRLIGPSGKWPGMTALFKDFNLPKPASKAALPLYAGEVRFLRLETFCIIGHKHIEAGYTMT